MMQDLNKAVELMSAIDCTCLLLLLFISLLLFFRIQNWRRGWDPKSRERIEMAALIGNIGPFDEKSEKFSDYADRFEAYVAANDIDNDKKVNVFYSCYRSRCLQVVEKLM